MIDYEQQRDTHSNMFKNAQRSKAKPNQKKIHVPTPKKRRKKMFLKKLEKIATTALLLSPPLKLQQNQIFIIICNAFWKDPNTEN